MSLSAGTRLGAYEIQTPIGEGGMGQVYKALDTRLDRVVAIKVLSPEVAGDPEFRLRFEREAKAISQLQHPHICTLFDVGRLRAEGASASQSPEVDYLVLEYLEGETLADRIAKGSVPVADALKIAIQISDALDKAHRLGIVHRDLKPGNVMLTKTSAKLLDFGLAKSMVPASGASDLSAAITKTTPLTGQGMILGTFQYMAPEQIEGTEADARSDIWAFGCLLHEMLTGQRTFEGKTRVGLIGAILKDEIAPVSGTVPLASSALDHVVETCLAKDPEERWQSAADITRELTWIAASKPDADLAPAAAGSRNRERLAWAAALVATAIVVTLMNPFRSASPPADAPVTRSVIALDSGFEATASQSSRAPGPQLSPDGRFLAYRLASQPGLALRDLASGETQVLPNTNGALAAFFSPDSRQLGFVANGELWRMPLGSGEPVMVFGGITNDSRGAAWGDDGYIYYTPHYGAGLWRIREEGGSSPEELTTLDPDRAEKSHRYPHVLPGSRAVLFVVSTARETTFDDATIEMLELDGLTRQVVVDRGTYPQYAPTGHILYSRGETILAVPFDVDRLARTGDPVAVAANVLNRPAFGHADFTLSRTGSLVSARPHEPIETELMAVDRNGASESVALLNANLLVGKLSPDGTRLAAWQTGATSQIAIVDLDSGLMAPLTFEWDNESPQWTADGSRIIVRSTSGGGVPNLFALDVNGSGELERLTTGPNIQSPGGPAGDLVPFVEDDPVTGADIWALNLADESVQAIEQTTFGEWNPALSSNGRWLAYVSNRSGTQEVLVQAFPTAGRIWTVSRGGGNNPTWHPNDRELLFRDGDAVIAVPFSGDSEFRPDAPVTLWEWDGPLLGVLPDGRFLMQRQNRPPPATEFDLVVNWFSELRQKMADAAR